MDNIIEARELQIERKHFYVELRENERGSFFRILNNGQKTQIYGSKITSAHIKEAEIAGESPRSHEKNESAALRLLLRRRSRGWIRRDEIAAGRQRRKSPRNDAHRPACAARIHHHDRSLHLLLRS